MSGHKSNMDLMQLEMFVATVEEGGVLKAAAKVLRTQPAVSIALRKLEHDIGAPLFDRSNRNDYALTDAGQLLYDYATRLLNLREEARSALESLQSLKVGRIRLGASESTSLYVLPKLILAFRELYPKIKIEVFRHLSARLPQELAERKLDFAIISDLPPDSGLEALPILQDELVLVVSPSHRLSKSKLVSIKDLGEEAFITDNIRSSSREKVMDVFRRHQTSFNVAIEISTVETIKKYVAMNLGVAFVPLMCVRDDLARGDLVMLPVEGFRHERTLWLVRRQSDGQSHAAQMFMKVIKSQPEERLSVAAERR
jgi:DNA-binding transcriptional LysR family regulator